MNIVIILKKPNKVKFDPVITTFNIPNENKGRKVIRKSNSKGKAKLETIQEESEDDSNL